MIERLIKNTFSKYPFRIIITFISLFIASMIYATSPMILGMIFSQSASQEINNLLIIKLVTLYVSMNICSSLFFASKGWLFSRAEEYFVRKLSTSLFEYICKLKYEFHTDKSSGRVNKILEKGYERTLAFIKYAIFSVGRSCLDVITISISVFIFCGKIFALIVLLYAICYSILTIYISSQRGEIFKKLLQYENELSSFTTESLINNTAIKYFNNEEYVTKKYEEIFSKYGTAHINISYSLSTLETLQSMIFYLFFGLLLITHYMTTSNLTSAIMLAQCISRIWAAIFNLGYSFKEMIQSFASIKDMMNLFETYNTEREGGLDIANNTPCDIKFQNVTFKYKEKIILNNLSFNIKYGESVAFVGNSGAGKSTIIHLLMGLLENYDGSIILNEHNIKDIKLQSLRKLIGIVPQSITLFNDTLYENIAYGNHIVSQQEIDNAIEKSGLKYLIDENGDNYTIGENGSKLSGGERQRVAIARVILRNANIVILDEATSALDNHLEKQIQQTFSKVAETSTSITIAHRLSTIVNLDKIFVLDQGRIIESGTHNTLLKQNGKYYELWNAQSFN